MSAGRISSRVLGSGRLLWAGEPVQDLRVTDLPALLEPGDLLVVNDSGTMPASLAARTEAGAPVELRLCGWSGELRRWPGVLFGAGDWRTPTEHRPPPPELEVGARIFTGDRVLELVERRGHPRLGVWDLGPEAWETIWRRGKPVQYSYMTENLPIRAVQLPYATRPWSAEMPSAGRPLSHALRTELSRRGIGLASLTHAAGLSSTGDDALDAELPLPEHYHLPSATVAAIARARRVIAVGTSVVRALEGNHRQFGALKAGEWHTDLVLDRHHRPQVVQGLLSGVHLPGESHFRLLEAFLGDTRLKEVAGQAQREGYRGHEFGDSMLVLA